MAQAAATWNDFYLNNPLFTGYFGSLGLLPKQEAKAPVTPSPQDPATAAAMAEAADETRRKGRAATYLSSPSAINQPGTLFNNSLTT